MITLLLVIQGCNLVPATPGPVKPLTFNLSNWATAQCPTRRSVARTRAMTKHFGQAVVFLTVVCFIILMKSMASVSSHGSGLGFTQYTHASIAISQCPKNPFINTSQKTRGTFIPFSRPSLDKYSSQSMTMAVYWKRQQSGSCSLHQIRCLSCPESDSGA